MFDVSRAGGWSGAPPPGVPTPGSRPTANLTFSQSLGGLSQPSTPLDMKYVCVRDRCRCSGRTDACLCVCVQRVSGSRWTTSLEYRAGLESDKHAEPFSEPRSTTAATATSPAASAASSAATADESAPPAATAAANPTAAAATRRLCRQSEGLVLNGGLQ